MSKFGASRALLFNFFTFTYLRIRVFFRVFQYLSWVIVSLRKNLSVYLVIFQRKLFWWTQDDDGEYVLGGANSRFDVDQSLSDSLIIQTLSNITENYPSSQLSITSACLFFSYQKLRISKKISIENQTRFRITTSPTSLTSLVGYASLCSVPLKKKRKNNWYLFISISLLNLFSISPSGGLSFSFTSPSLLVFAKFAE